MADNSALSYMVARPPRELSYGAPQVDFSWLSRLPEDYQQGQQYAFKRNLQTMFQPGTPGAAALAREGIDPNSLFGILAGAGGAEVAAPLAQKMIGGQIYQNIMRGGGPTPGQTFGQRTSSANSDNEGYDTVRSLMPSDTANSVPQPVMDRIAKVLGVKDADTPLNPQQMARVMEIVQKNKIGMREDTASVSQPGTGAPAPTEQPPGATGSPPFMPSQSSNAGGPGNIKLASAGSPDEFVSQPTVPTNTGEVAANTGGGEAANRTPPGAPNVQPGNRDVMAQGPAATTGAETAGEAPVPQGYTRQAVQNMRKAADQLDRSAGALGASGFPAEASKSQQERAAALRAQADTIEKFLNEREQQKYGVGIEGKKEVQKARVGAGEKAYEGINAQAQQFGRDLKPMLQVSKAILNDPDMYTGFGAERRLDFNRIKATFGDTRAAMLQEALKKVTATSVLSDLNIQKDQMQEAGAQSGRIFRQTADLVQQAAPTLENTLAGNRALIEIKSRMGELSLKVAEMARDYRRTHPYLDDGFDQKLHDYMKNNPVFTKQELAHPEILGAPTLPSVKVDVKAWGKKHGLNSGDPIRTPDGRVAAVP